MSLVSLLTTNLMATRRASDAEFGMQTTAQQIMQGVNQASPNLSFGAVKQLHDRENNLMARMLKLNFIRQASIAQAESAEKMKKDNIKRSFSIFA